MHPLEVFTSRGCDVWCGEPSSLLQERAAMRLAAEVELDDRVHGRRQDSSFVVRAKYWHAAIGRLMKSQRLNWKKSDTFIRVWHELAGDSVTAHWLVRTLDENEVARMLFRISLYGITAYSLYRSFDIERAFR